MTVKDKPTWVFDDRSKSYRDTASGQYISPKEAIKRRDEFIEAQKAITDRLTDQLSSRQIDLNRWIMDMREVTKDTYSTEYMWGKGGRNNMTQRDWGIIGRELRDQYGFLDNFANDMAQGKLTEAQARVRARMYIDGGTQMYERARSESMGLPRLSQYPADGQTQCLTKCKCHLEYNKAESGWEVYWVLGDAEHCHDCEDMAAEWNPLQVSA